MPFLCALGHPVCPHRSVIMENRDHRGFTERPGSDDYWWAHAHIDEAHVVPDSEVDWGNALVYEV